MFPFWRGPDGWLGRNRHDAGPERDSPAPRDHGAGAVDDLIGSIARRTADEWLAGRTAEALRMDPLVCGSHVEVVVQNAVVILLGELRSAEATEAAGRCVWTVAGVRDVCNRLTVTKPSAAS